MYCKNCGKQIDDDSKFCNYCGTKQSININRVSNSEKEKIEINPNNQVTQNHSLSTQSEIEYDKKGKYDESYDKETGATVVGFIVLITNFLIVSVKPEVNELTYILVGAISLVLRIIFTVWIVNIAKRQNRPASQWGFSGFMFPSITLIIIGLCKKLIKDSQKDQTINSSSYSPKESFRETKPLINEYLTGSETERLEINIPAYKETYLGIKWSVLGGKLENFKIEFSDGIIGELIENKYNGNFGFICQKSRYYYTSKPAAIQALYHFKVTGSISEKDRTIFEKTPFNK